MKKQIVLLLTAVLLLALFSAHAQPGGGFGPPRGPRMNKSMVKLLGEHSAFSANAEMQIRHAAGESMTLPGKLAFSEGKSRFEMDLANAKGAQMQPGAAAQMKAMGMDISISISRPDKKAAYVVYPGLQAYAEMPLPDSDAATGSEGDYKIETTELGKETLNGHPCVKNKVVVTDDKGKSSEFTVWNATDLKKFPLKIETTDPSLGSYTMIFSEVKLAKPDASQFEPPADYKKYDNMMSLMREEMMKRMGGGRPMPPGHP